MDGIMVGRRIKGDFINIERLAEVISSLVKDITEVEFSTFGKESLSVAVIKQLRRKVDKKMKWKLVKIWDCNERNIHGLVKESLSRRYGVIDAGPNLTHSDVSIQIAETRADFDYRSSQKVGDFDCDDSRVSSLAPGLETRSNIYDTPKSRKNFIYLAEDDQQNEKSPSYNLSEHGSSLEGNIIHETGADFDDSWSQNVTDVEHHDARVPSPPPDVDANNSNWSPPKSGESLDSLRFISNQETHEKVSKVLNCQRSSPERDFTDDNTESSSSDSVSGYLEPQKSPAMRKKFSEAMGNIQIPSTKLKGEDGNIDKDKIRYKISETMLNVLRYCCPLSFYGGIRPNSQSFVTYAKCRYPSHEQTFRFELVDFEKPMSRIYLSSTKCDEIIHDGPKIYCTLRGKKRDEVKARLRSVLPRKLQLETAKDIDPEIAQDGHMQDLRRLSTYQKAKSEENSKNDAELRSNDLSDLFQQHVIDSACNDPYIRQTGLPLYVHMYSMEQLNVIGTEDIIVYFDSTGSVVRKPVDVKCKRIMYYAMVINKNGSLIPIAEMVSSEHDVASISIFLKRYRYFLLTQSIRWPIFRVVVVDWSWALINSVLNEWNMISVTDYLKKAFTCLLSETAPSFNLVVVHSCCAHFQKRVSSNIQKDFPKFIHLKGFVLECMGLMIHCSDMVVLDEVFEEFVTVLMTTSKNQAERSISRLHELHIRVTGTSMGSRVAEEKLSEELVVEPTVDDVVTGKVSTDSPFFNRYFAKLTKIKDSILDLNNCNKYHAPEIADYITKRYMPFVPMWSALLLKLVAPNVARLSNANVESHFNLVKKQVLNNEVNLKVGRFVKKMKDYTGQLCAEVVIGTPIKLRRGKKPKYVRPNAESPNNPLVQEMWRRKRKAQFSHFEGRSLGRIAKKVTTSSFRTSTPKINTENHEQSLLNKSDSSMHANALPNGLFSDVAYYMRVKEPQFTVGRYSSTTCATVVGFDEYLLFSTEFQSLEGRRWLDGDVIDCFCIAKLADWKNVIYVPTRYTSHLLGEYCTVQKSETWRMYNIVGQLSGKILMPYLYKMHWCLLVLDVDKQTWMHLDPQSENGPDKRRAFGAFKQYIAQCSARKSNALCEASWREIDCKTARPIQSVEDRSNCGLYVLHYLEYTGLNRKFNLRFAPDSYRKEVAEALLNLSHDMKDICQFCFSRRETNLVMCSTCRRWTHQLCIQRILGIQKTMDEWNEPTSKYRCPLCNQGTRDWMRY